MLSFWLRYELPALKVTKIQDPLCVHGKINT